MFLLSLIGIGLSFFITPLIIKDSFYFNKNKHHENSDFVYPSAKATKSHYFLYIIHAGGCGCSLGISLPDNYISIYAHISQVTYQL